MPRFYFDLRDGENIRDEEGTELSNLEDAEAQALTVLTNVIQWMGSDWEHVSINVRDDVDRLVLRVSANVKIERLSSADTSTAD